MRPGKTKKTVFVIGSHDETGAKFSYDIPRGREALRDAYITSYYASQDCYRLSWLLLFMRIPLILSAFFNGLEWLALIILSFMWIEPLVMFSTWYKKDVLWMKIVRLILLISGLSELAYVVVWYVTGWDDDMIQPWAWWLITIFLVTHSFFTIVPFAFPSLLRSFTTLLDALFVYTVIYSDLARMSREGYVESLKNPSDPRKQVDTDRGRMNQETRRTDISSADVNIVSTSFTEQPPSQITIPIIVSNSTSHSITSSISPIRKMD